MYSSQTSGVWVQIWPQKRSRAPNFSWGACPQTPLPCACLRTHHHWCPPNLRHLPPPLYLPSGLLNDLFMAGQADLSTCIQATCIQVTIFFSLECSYPREQTKKQNSGCKPVYITVEDSNEEKPTRAEMRPLIMKFDEYRFLL